MQRLPHGNVGEHDRPLPLRRQDQHLGSGLPLDALLHGFGQRGGIVSGIVQGQKRAAVRQRNRVVEKRATRWDECQCS